MSHEEQKHDLYERLIHKNAEDFQYIREIFQIVYYQLKTSLRQKKFPIFFEIMINS